MTTNTLRDMVYSAVLTDIVNGKLTVNSVIHEKSLSERLHVSKAPVREALISLCSNGILRSVPRIGYMVVRYTTQNLRDILAYRTMLECGCLELSFGHITTTQVLRLESIVSSEKTILSVGDPRDYWSATLNFHLTLASFADNEYVYRHLDDALNTSIRAYLQLYWEQLKEHCQVKPSILHQQVIEAIRIGDKNAALDLLRQDINTLIEETNELSAL